MYFQSYDISIQSFFSAYNFNIQKYFYQKEKERFKSVFEQNQQSQFSKYVISVLDEHVKHFNDSQALPHFSPAPVFLPHFPSSSSPFSPLHSLFFLILLLIFSFSSSSPFTFSFSAISAFFSPLSQTCNACFGDSINSYVMEKESV